MTSQQTAPYGTWNSPVTPEMVTDAGIRLGETKTDGPDVYWLEGRPAEGGRNVIVRLGGPNGEPGPVDVTPEGYNVRNRVHEYGGAAYEVNDGVVYFSNFADQRIYRHKSGEQPNPVTADPDIPAGDRFADGRFTPDGRFLVCVRERHVEGREAVNEVVAVQVDGSVQTVLASGHDFYSFPRLSPDGTRLAYTAWDHPNMPWDEAELWVAALSPDGASSGAVQVAGGSGESIFQPEWSPGGTLHFVSDRTGWWNLYALEEDTAEPLFPGNTESGEPQWVFGQSTYAFLPDGSIALVVGGDAGRRLMIIDGDRQAREIELPYTSMGGLVATGSDVLITAASSADPAAIVRVDTDTGAVEVVRKSSEIEIDAGLISRPQSVTFPTGDGEEAHAYYYPPTNPGFKAPASEMPPVIVLSHGGPTSAASRVVQPGHSVLDEPRLCSDRCQLSRIDRLRPGVQGRAEGAMGRGRHRGLHQRCAAPGRPRSCRRAPGDHQRWQRRRIYDPVRASVSRLLRGRRELLRCRGRRDARHRHTQI